MKVTIIQMQRTVKNLPKTCDLGFEHEVPGVGENVWIVIEGEEDPWKIAKERYPEKDGWVRRFGTTNAVKID